MKNEVENLSAELKNASMLADKLNETVKAIQETNSWHSKYGVDSEGAIRKYANSPCNLYSASDLNSDSRLMDLANYLLDAARIAKQLEEAVSKTSIKVTISHL